MRKIPGGGVLLENAEEARIAEQLVREKLSSPRLTWHADMPSDEQVMKEITDHMAQPAK